MKNQIFTSIKGRNSVANLQKKQILTTLILILSMIMCIQNLVLICPFVLKILSKKQILMSIKGRNSVANLRKTMIYITNVDLVNDYVYTKFGLNWFICFQDIEQKLNTDVNQGPLLCCKFDEIRTHPSFHACPRYLQEWRRSN